MVSSRSPRHCPRPPAAPFIPGEAQMAAAPGVHEGIGGSGVEARSRGGSSWQRGHVGDTAEVEDRAVLIGGAQERVVKRRRQWRALAARGQVTAAKVRHGGNGGKLGDDIGVPDLQAIGRLSQGGVMHRLTVTADGADVLPWVSRISNESVGRGGEQPPISTSRAMTSVMVRGGRHAAQSAVHAGCPEWVDCG